MKRSVFIFLFWALAKILSAQNITCANNLDSTCEAVRLQICTSWNFGPPPPSFWGYNLTNKSGHLTMNVYYNMPLAANASFSARADTIYCQLQPGTLSLQVKINVIYNGTIQAINSSSNIPVCSPAGLMNLTSDPGVYFFPNPAKDYLKIEGNRFGCRLIEVLDVFGKVLISAKDESVMDISALAPGTYFVKCDNILKGKFLKTE